MVGSAVGVDSAASGAVALAADDDTVEASVRPAVGRGADGPGPGDPAAPQADSSKTANANEIGSRTRTPTDENAKAIRSPAVRKVGRIVQTAVRGANIAGQTTRESLPQ
jgi:hypothetical protein